MSQHQQNRSPSSPKVSILMYHQVGPFESPRRHRAVFCHIDRFRRQMHYLKRLGYAVISLEDAYQGLFKAAPLPPRPVVLTFDDGYESFATHAWPVLQSLALPATVFLVSDLIGGNARWIDDMPEQAALMSAATIRALHREGVQFGSHARSHRRLTQLPHAVRRDEIVRSRSSLEGLLGTSVADFCYPYGNYDVPTRDFVAEAGYRLALTCIRGAANAADNPFEIPRKAISFGDNLIGYAWKLHTKHVPKVAYRVPARTV